MKKNAPNKPINKNIPIVIIPSIKGITIFTPPLLSINLCLISSSIFLKESNCFCICFKYTMFPYKPEITDVAMLIINDKYGINDSITIVTKIIPKPIAYIFLYKNHHELKKNAAQFQLVVLYSSCISLNYGI